MERLVISISLVAALLSFTGATSYFDTPYYDGYDLEVNATCWNMTATCDNKMKVYFDGDLQPGNDYELNSVYITSLFCVPIDTQVVAIECENTIDYNGGILADIDNGIVTDASWKCSSHPSQGWTLPSFPPNAWPNAYGVESNSGGGTWQTVDGIKDDAKWIWTSDWGSVGPPQSIYCRNVVLTDCSQCAYEGDNGYMIHPNPCKFIMCRRVPAPGGYTFYTTAMQCAQDTLWDQNILTCNHDTEDICPDIPVPTYPTETAIIPTFPACYHPLLYFPFEDDFNSERCEQAVSGHAGSGSVTLSWEHVKEYKSAHFDGNSLLLVPFLKNHFANSNVQGFTVALWFKWESNLLNLGGLVNNDDCEFGASSFDIRVGPGQTVSASLSTDDAQDVSAGTFPISLWSWTHVAEVYDGSTLKLYIDGVEKSSTILTGGMVNTHCSLRIGHVGHEEPEESWFFQGHIDELMIFRRALDSDEIQDVLNLDYESVFVPYPYP